jgi:hypothetical protein
VRIRIKNKGVQQLLDVVVDYLPSPVDIPPIEGLTTDRSAAEIRKAEIKSLFSGLIFKIMTDPVCRTAGFFSCLFRKHERRRLRLQFDQASVVSELVVS